MLKKTSSQLATQSNLFPTMFPRSSFPSKVHPPQQPIFYDMERPVLYLEQAELTLLGLENCPTGMLIAELVLPIYEEVQVRVDENPLGYLAEHTRPKNVKLEVEMFRQKLSFVFITKKASLGRMSPLRKSFLSSLT